MESIESKLNWEWELFYLDMMRTSRENIFTKSKEIEYKKCIWKHTKSICMTLSDQAIQTLLVKENIIDYMYTFLLEKELISEADIQYQLQKLLGGNHDICKAT